MQISAIARWLLTSGLSLSLRVYQFRTQYYVRYLAIRRLYKYALLSDNNMQCNYVSLMGIVLWNMNIAVYVWHNINVFPKIFCRLARFSSLHIRKNYSR